VIPLSPGQELTDFPAISPDGETVAYAARAGSGESRLFLRSINSFEAREVPGSGGAEEPFFSPDGRWIGFFGQGQLLKAALAGGSPIKLAGAPFPFGGMWNKDDSIIYVPDEVSGLMRIPAAGGMAESLTKPDGGPNGFSHLWPQPLPGGRSILFSIRGKSVDGVAVLSLDSRQWQLVLPGATGAIFLPERSSPVNSSGWLVSSDESAGIRLAPFDASHPAPTVANTPVLTDVYSKSGSNRSWLTVSTNGNAAFVSGNLNRRSLVRVDRDGKLQAVSTELAGYSQSILSPDASKALELIGADLWIYDLSTGARRRLTSYGDSGVAASSPMWSRDGSRILFSSNEGVDRDIYSQPADGSRPPETLLKRPNNQYPTSMAPDGTLLFGEAYPDKGEDLMTMSPDGQVSPFRVTAQFTEINGQFSPDGHWVAYQSDESGRSEIYVEAFPAGGKRIAVSTEGGVIPMWSRNGKELFFIGGDSVMTAPVKPDGSFGPTQKLFDRAPFNFFWHSYDPSPDGKWFLMIHSDQTPRQINVIQNWISEFNQVAHAK
jgi:Tol biopolymer transport system component